MVLCLHEATSRNEIRTFRYMYFKLQRQAIVLQIAILAEWQQTPPVQWQHDEHWVGKGA